MRHLLCDLTLKGLNVLQYAAKKCATGLLDNMLQTQYVFANPIDEKFEVTHLFPDTVPEKSANELSSEVDNDNIDRSPTPPGDKPLACLELIVNCEDVESAEEILGLFPFNQLMQGYWVWCQRMYNTLLIAHVVFMAMFTVYVMPTTNFIRRRFNLTAPPNEFVSAEADAVAEEYRVETLPLYGLFLIWPAIIVFMELVGALEYAYRTYKNINKTQKKRKKRNSASRDTGDDDDDENAACRCSWKQFRHSIMKLFAFGKLLLHGFEYMSHVAALAFCSSVVAW
jgi:hypothetical protein